MIQTASVRAIYRDGTLQLLEPVDLPEGAEVWIALRVVEPQPRTQTPSPHGVGQRGLSYPTRPQPPETLVRLIGLVAVGGNALADSEALYDADWY